MSISTPLSHSRTRSRQAQLLASSKVKIRCRRERGQTTAEYALVLLAAGSIAMLAVGWAQGNDAIGSLFDSVLSRITSLMA